MEPVLDTPHDAPAGDPAGVVCPGVWPVHQDPTVEEVARVLEWLATVDGSLTCDADRVDQIAGLEQLKGAAAAAQSRITVRFQDSQLGAQEARGVRAKDRGRGIGDQVAMARGCATSQGGRWLGFSRAVVCEMPHTHSLLTAGQISEWVATLLVRETAVLSLEDRQLVDERLCAMRVDTGTGEVLAPAVLGLTPREVEKQAKSLAAQLDPEAVVRRTAKAAGDRKVTIRPAPDTMTWVSALLPVAQGVATWANLDKSARALKSQGDPRRLDQIRADLLVERITGQATAAAVPVEIVLVSSQETLAGDSEQPARTADGTVIPAGVARDLIEQTADAGADQWIREATAHPQTGELVDVGKRKRFHRGNDRRFVRHRDQICRHPRCDRPIEHGDHPKPVARNGPTDRANAQGLCEGHNYVKEMPGWSSEVVDARPGHHTIRVTTPTGHTYDSHAPPALPPLL